MRLVGKLLQLLISSLLTMTILGMIGVIGLYIYYAPQLPNNQALHQIELHVPLRIYSREERLVAEYGEKRRRPVNIDEIPANLRNAFIAIEDARFYEHPGIDIKGILRAAYNVMISRSASQGASTITMQLARNSFLGNEKTLERKFKEVLLAIRLEKELSKNEILELYLNKIYLGNRAYGIGAAAKTYYGKEPHELTLAEMAMIAGLPKAPSRYNPIVNPSRATTRRDYILKRMWEQRYISEDEYRTGVATDITARVHKANIQTNAPYLAEMVRAFIVEKYGKDSAYSQGYHVYTTLDSQFQEDAVTSIRKKLLDYDRRHGYRGAEGTINLSDGNREEWLDQLSAYSDVGGLQAALVTQSDKKHAELLLQNETSITLTLSDVKWAREFISADRRGRTPKSVNAVLKPGDVVRIRNIAHQDKNKSKSVTDTENKAPEEWQLTQIPSVSGALVLMDPKDGAVRAVMGGFDYYHSKFNRAAQAMRQPGSSFKPFIYSAALSKGYTPTSIINDAPINLPGSDWQPKNFGGKYIGPTTLKEALAKSRNLVSIRLMRDAGIDYTVDYATRFGFETKHLPPNLTLALGTGLTTPLQMAGAYSSFANGGFKVSPHFITRIEDSQGNTLFDAINETHRACGDKVKVCQLAISDGVDSTDSDLNTENTTTPAQAEETTTELSTIESATDTTAAVITQPAAQRVMDSRTHYQIVSMLRGVTRFGTAARAGRTLKRNDIAGKTGTTNDQRDAWFCGFNQDYVGVAWVGFDDMAELGKGETATRLALPLWIDLMQSVLKDIPVKEWKRPETLYRVERDESGSLISTVSQNEPPDTGILSGEFTTESKGGFEFKSAIAVHNTPPPVPANPAAAPHTAQQPAPRPARVESVEIPEQIF